MSPVRVRVPPPPQIGVAQTAVLLASAVTDWPLVGVSGGVRSAGELCHGDGANGQLDMELTSFLSLGCGESGTRVGILGCDAVEVGAKPGQGDARSTREHSDNGVGIHESVASKRGQLALRVRHAG